MVAVNKKLVARLLVVPLPEVLLQLAVLVELVLLKLVVLQREALLLVAQVVLVHLKQAVPLAVVLQPAVLQRVALAVPAVLVVVLAHLRLVALQNNVNVSALA